MDAQQFLAAFGHIANAPGGVGKLRELVLHLAVSGDLVASEIPVDASPLLTAIEQQKREHTEKKKVISKQPSVLNGLVKAPPHWAICRLGDLALTITGGGTPSKNNPAYWGGDIPWASVKDMKDLKFLDETEDHITAEGLKNSSSNLIPPGRVIVCTRMGLGKIAINRVALSINQDLKALELPKEVNSDFFLILYKTREVSGTGTTVSGIKQDQLLALPVALPPVAEQSRIVAKVDELMALCDKLEAQQQARRKLQNALRQSTLQAMASATSPHELQEGWKQLHDSLGELFTEPGDVARLREMVRALAIQGRLVAQNPNDKHASNLLCEISENKQKMISSGQLRREMPWPQVSKQETPFQVPDGWVWVRFGEVTINRDGERVPVSSVDRATVEKLYDYYGASGVIDKINDFIFDKTLLLVGEDGANLINRSTPIAFLAHGKYWVNNHAHVIDATHRELLDYLTLFLNSISLEPYITGTAQPKLNQAKLNNIPVAMPPLAEQSRIVAKVNELMALCDKLEQQLHKKDSLSALLANAFVSAFTNITTGQQQKPTPPHP